MLRAQCILFRRYGAVLAPYKYAGYPQLLEVLRQQQAASTATGGKAGASTTPAAGAPASADAGAGDATAAASLSSSSSAPAAAAGGHFLSGERVGQVLAAIELCWLTCVASRRNAEELMRSGGLPLLAGLLTR
jgi:DnaJ family protein C protein 13